jgi:hypothetical protein
MNHDLEQAVSIALEPITSQRVLCAFCGAVRQTLDEHVCRAHAADLPGMEKDDRRRAKSYSVE